MESVLLFRTDRVGDFLLSLSLIKIIKINYPNSKITVVASKKNYDYIRSFDEIHDVVLLNNSLFSKLNLIFKLRKNKYDTVIVHDGKNRSRFVSFFLKYKKRILCFTNLIDTQLDIIRKACNDLGMTYHNSCLDFLENRKHTFIDIPFSNYVQLHIDEKWSHEKYIKKYVSIEPTDVQLLDFINKIISKDRNSDKAIILENQNLLELENVVFKSNLLITCHGWISHIASARKIKQIDIIDEQYPYNKWTSHFRNYNYLFRKSFVNLSDEIFKLI